MHFWLQNNLQPILAEQIVDRNQNRYSNTKKGLKGNFQNTSKLASIKNSIHWVQSQKAQTRNTRYIYTKTS
jgi:hypothetical protein